MGARRTDGGRRSAGGRWRGTRQRGSEPEGRVCPPIKGPPHPEPAQQGVQSPLGFHDGNLQASGKTRGRTELEGSGRDMPHPGPSAQRTAATRSRGRASRRWGAPRPPAPRASDGFNFQTRQRTRNATHWQAELLEGGLHEGDVLRQYLLQVPPPLADVSQHCRRERESRTVARAARAAPSPAATRATAVQAGALRAGQRGLGGPTAAS